MPNNLAALTVLQSPYPAFVSINDTGTNVEVHARAQGGEPYVVVALSYDEWRELRRQIIERGEI